MMFARQIAACFSVALFIAGVRADETPALRDFQNRITAYVKLRQEAQSQAPKPKANASAEDVAKTRKSLAEAIRKARPDAKQGDIFTPEIGAAFRKLADLDGSDEVRVKESLKRAEPVHIQVTVNQIYPSAAPLQSTPPTLLMALPKLPKELEYRIVEKNLILHDIESNLVVDFLPNAIP